MPQIEVLLDPRIRLATAVLAASRWPAWEQAIETHAVHPHAKQVRHFVAPFQAETAVQQLNQQLDADQDCQALLSTMLTTPWEAYQTREVPAGWSLAVADFLHKTQIAQQFWPAHDALWQTAVSELQTILHATPLPNLWQSLSEKLPNRVQIMPTLVYPMLQPFRLTAPQQLLVLLPPPKAVGESPPWPYREDPPWVVVQLSNTVLTTILPTTGLTAVQSQQLRHAAIAIGLEQSFDPFECQAYLIRCRKAFQLPDMPQVADRLRTWLDAPEKRPLTTIVTDR